MLLQPSDIIGSAAAEVQRSSAPDLTQGRDAIIQAQTGSGKTLSYLLPLLSTLDYPPDVYPDDLKASTPNRALTDESAPNWLQMAAWPGSDMTHCLHQLVLAHIQHGGT